MSQIVKVKQLNIGNGMPKICVPLVGKTDEELKREAKSLHGLTFDLVEWRVDFYEQVEEITKVKQLLESLHQLLNEKPILFTFRTKSEGGVKEISTAYYVQLNKEIVATRLVDLIDVELFAGDDIVNELVDVAHDFGVKVVMSSHDFVKTPPQAEIVQRLCKMQEMSADLPKIAVMPQNSKDVLTLLAATDEMKTNHPNTPVITISMGKLGVVSRIVGETVGSAITFGSVKQGSAPGQIPVDELACILKMIHSE